jgi:hypothetical protein
MIPGEATPLDHAGMDLRHDPAYALLLGLDLGTQIVQALIGVSDVGDLCGDGVDCGIAVRRPGNTQQQGHARDRGHDRPDQPRGRSRDRAPACASHSTQLSLRLNADGGVDPGSLRGPIDNTSIM